METKDKFDIIIDQCKTMNLHYLLYTLFGVEDGKKVFNTCTDVGKGDEQPCLVLIPSKFLAWLKKHRRQGGIMEGSEGLNAYLFIKNREIKDEIKKYISL